MPNFVEIGRHLGFSKYETFNGGTAREGRPASPCQSLSKSVKPRPRYGDFSIFQDGRRRHLGFVNFGILMVGQLKRVEVCRRAKFGRNRSNRGGDMTILRFFKMAAAAILDFQNFKLLMVRRLKRVEVHRHAKFGQNMSKCGADMTDFSIFQDGGRRHLAFLNF